MRYWRKYHRWAPTEEEAARESQEARTKWARDTKFTFESRREWYKDHPEFKDEWHPSPAKLKQYAAANAILMLDCLLK